MQTASTLCSIFLLGMLPLAAQAGRCEHSESRTLNLNLDGVKTVAFEIASNTLVLNASKGASATVSGKSCASDKKLFADLVFDQHRVGDKLMIRAKRRGGINLFSWSGDRYAYLLLDATLPNDVAVHVNVGSGDATVTGTASLAGDVGSGELQARNIRGTFYADVGSGEIDADGIGALHAVSVGSGDLSANNIGGNVRVGTVGSGELSARSVNGNVQVGSISSGGIQIAGAKGRVDIGSIGSGDADLSDVGGDVHVEDIGSGGLEAYGVRGALTVDEVGSGSVSHRNVVGQVRVPKDE